MSSSGATTDAMTSSLRRGMMRRWTASRDNAMQSVWIWRSFVEKLFVLVGYAYVMVDVEVGGCTIAVVDVF